MATITAAANGLWSNTATWVGGVLPGPADIANASTFTVTIDQDITVSSLLRSAGGTFLVTAASAATPRTLNVTTLYVSNVSASALLTMTGGTATSNAAVSSSMASPTTYALAISGGSFTCGSVDVSNSSSTAVSITGGTLTCTTVTSHSTGSSPAITMSNGTLNCGNVNGAGSTGGAINISGGICNANNISSVGGRGMKVSGNNVTINCSSLTAGASDALECGVIGSGTQYTGCTITVNGAVTASNNSPALIVPNASNTVRVKGPLTHGENNFAPIAAQKWMVFASTPTSWAVRDDSNSPNTGAVVTLSNTSSGIAPVQSDVRDGVTYSGGLIGSLKVPPTQSVSYGVPVDNTVGSGTLKLAEIADVLGSQIAAALTS